MEDLYSKNGRVHTYDFTFSPSSPEYVQYKSYKYGQKIHLWDYYLHASTATWEPDKALSPILPNASVSDTKNQTKRRKKKKRPQTKKIREGLKRRTGTAVALASNEWDYIRASTACILSFKSSQAENNLFKTTYHQTRTLSVNSSTGGKNQSCDLMPRPHELFCGNW